MIVTWIGIVSDPAGVLGAAALHSLLRKKVKAVTIGGAQVGMAHDFLVGTTAWNTAQALRCTADIDNSIPPGNNSTGMMIDGWTLNLEQLVSTLP